MSPLTLSLVIHNHQPVGNFDDVFTQATVKAYAPMLAALERHPRIRLSLHYSGPLLDWLAANQPAHLDRLKDLVDREQVELLSGGYYEPILVSIPRDDKLGQLHKMNDCLQELFGTVTRGAWLAERIWEPHLPVSLAEAGADYTVLDDTPFKMAGLSDDDLFGAYVTEEEGATVQVFGSPMYLRYAIPWRPVETVMAWLEDQAERHPGGVTVFADDGEKFGFWPNTWEHCWGAAGWVDRFFEALEHSSKWLETRPLGEIAESKAPLGRIYLPCAAYEEMMHWALPPDAFAKLGRVREELEVENRQDILRFVGGGAWRSFLGRYDEINQMHKKMLWVSRKVHALPEGELKDRALDHTWSAQCNCGYWHGLFGGIYLFHIRVANYAHLIAAETLADRAMSPTETWLRVERGDLDADTSEEVILNSDQQVMVFKPAYGGALVEWDWRARRYNLLNTMARRREGYHEALREAAEQGRLYLAGEEKIPKGVQVKEHDVHTRLFFDGHRRVSLLDHFLHGDTTPEDFYQGHHSEQGDFVDQPYLSNLVYEDGKTVLSLRRDGMVQAGAVRFPVRVEKSISTRPASNRARICYRVTNLNAISADFRFGVEFNWGIVGGDSPYGFLLADSERRALGDFAGDDEIGSLTVGSTLPDLAGAVRIHTSRAANLWHFPLEVVSNSEAGYERVYQGTCTLLWWSVFLEPQRPWEVEMTIDLRELQGTV